MRKYKIHFKSDDGTRVTTTLYAYDYDIINGCLSFNDCGKASYSFAEGVWTYVESLNEACFTSGVGSQNGEMGCKAK